MAPKTRTFILAAIAAGVALYRLSQRPALGSSSSAKAGPGLGADGLSTAKGSNEPKHAQDWQLASTGLGTTANADHEDLLTPSLVDGQH